MQNKQKTSVVRRRVAALAAGACSLAMLLGCGQKGALSLPKPPAQAASASTR